MRYCARPEAEFLGEIQTNVLTVFLLAIHNLLYSFDISIFFKLTQPLTVSTVQLLYSVRCKEERRKPDRKPYLLTYCLRNPYRNIKSENSQVYAQKSQ